MDFDSLQIQHTYEMQKDSATWKFWQTRRYVIAMLMFLGYFSSSILQVNMSMAVVAMTSNSSEKNMEFDWDSKLQGYILSSSFYGNMSTILLGGWLSSRLGGKRVFGIGIGMISLFTLIIPPLVKLNVYYLIALRAVGGMFQGAAFPCNHAVWRHWAPPLERSKLGTASYSGYPLGVVFGMSACGVIAEQLGWAYIFYITGTIGLIFCILWFYNVKDDPADDPKISFAELNYIKQSLGLPDNERKEHSHPWKAMLSSSAVWAIILVDFSKNWDTWLIATVFPKFMNTVLNFKLQETGYLSALPHLLFFITLPTFGYLVTHLQRKEVLTTTKLRKIFTCSGLTGQIIFMTFVIFSNQATVTIICIILTIGCSGIATSGFYTNHLDIAPRHASVLLGMSSTSGMLAGIICPIMTGYIVQDGTMDEWRIVFIASNVIFFGGAVIYGCLASSEEQKWADEKITELNSNSNVNLAVITDLYLKKNTL